MEYFFFTINIVSSKPLVGHLPRIKMSFLLRIYTHELISELNTITFLTAPLPSDNKRV